jgi:hypothetical protein
MKIDKVRLLGQPVSRRTDSDSGVARTHSRRPQSRAGLTFRFERATRVCIVGLSVEKPCDAMACLLHQRFSELKPHSQRLPQNQDERGRDNQWH